MNAKQFLEASYKVGSLLLIFGVLSLLLKFYPGKFLYAIGAILYLLAFSLSPIKELDLRTRRLYRMNVLAGAFFVVSSVLVFIRKDTLWLALFTVGVVYMIYASLLLVFKKKEKPKKEKK